MTLLGVMPNYLLGYQKYWIRSWFNIQRTGFRRHVHDIFKKLCEYTLSLVNLENEIQHQNSTRYMIIIIFDLKATYVKSDIRL